MSTEIHTQYFEQTLPLNENKSSLKIRQNTAQTFPSPKAIFSNSVTNIITFPRRLIFSQTRKFNPFILGRAMLT